MHHNKQKSSQMFLPSWFVHNKTQGKVKWNSSQENTVHIYSSGLSRTAGKPPINLMAPCFKSTFCMDDIPWDPSSDCCVTGGCPLKQPSHRINPHPALPVHCKISECCTSTKEHQVYIYSSRLSDMVLFRASGWYLMLGFLVWYMSNSKPVFLPKNPRHL